MPLEDVSIEDLRATLDEVEGRKPTERLLAAIIYKQGPSVPTIAEWFGREPDTVYRWFERLETRPVLEAVRDDPRPGRPSRLDPEEMARFDAALSGTPREWGYDREKWTPRLVQQLLSAEFGVEYSLRHTRRLIDRRSVEPS